MQSIVTSKNNSWPRLIWPTQHLVCTTVYYSKSTVYFRAFVVGRPPREKELVNFCIWI